MKPAPFRRILPLLTASCLLLLIAPPLSAGEEEGPTVQEIRERIEEQMEEAEEEEEQEYPYEEDDEEDGLGGLFFELFFRALEILFLNSLPIRYAEYPYAALQAVPFGYQAPEFEQDPDYHRLAYANLSLEGAWLQQERWVAAGRLSFNVLPLHLEGYFQLLFDPTDRIAFSAVCGGLTLPAHRFILNLFAGAFFTDLSPRAMFSFGASAQLFLPGKFILDVYSINAVYGSLAINYFSATLNRALSAANLGVGFNLNQYAGILLMGPQVRLSFWL